MDHYKLYRDLRDRLRVLTNGEVALVIHPEYFPFCIAEKSGGYVIHLSIAFAIEILTDVGVAPEDVDMYIPMAMMAGLMHEYLHWAYTKFERLWGVSLEEADIIQYVRNIVEDAAIEFIGSNVYPLGTVELRLFRTLVVQDKEIKKYEGKKKHDIKSMLYFLLIKSFRPEYDFKNIPPLFSGAVLDLLDEAIHTFDKDARMELSDQLARLIIHKLKQFVPPPQKQQGKSSGSPQPGANDSGDTDEDATPDDGDSGDQDEDSPEGESDSPSPGDNGTPEETSPEGKTDISSSGDDGDTSKSDDSSKDSSADASGSDAKSKAQADAEAKAKKQAEADAKKLASDNMKEAARVAKILSKNLSPLESNKKAPKDGADQLDSFSIPDKVNLSGWDSIVGEDTIGMQISKVLLMQREHLNEGVHEGTQTGRFSKKMLPTSDYNTKIFQRITNPIPADIISVEIILDMSGSMYPYTAPEVSPVIQGFMGALNRGGIPYRMLGFGSHHIILKEYDDPYDARILGRFYSSGRVQELGSTRLLNPLLDAYNSITQRPGRRLILCLTDGDLDSGKQLVTQLCSQDDVLLIMIGIYHSRLEFVPSEHRFEYRDARTFGERFPDKFRELVFSKNWQGGK